MDAQQVQPPTQTPPVPTATVNDGNPWIKWVLIVVAIALLSSGATYVVLTTQTKQQPTTTQPQPEASQPLAETLTPDPTANWETYQDVDNKYSVRFPNNWGRGECPTGTLMLNIGPEFKDDPTYICRTDKFPTINFSISDRFEITPLGSEYGVSSEGKLKVGENQAKYIVYRENQSSPGPQEYMEVSIFDSRNKKYIIATLYNMEERNTFEKILSTFKFD